MPTGPYDTYSFKKLGPQCFPEDVRTVFASLVPNIAAKAGTIMGYVSASSVNDVYTLTPGGTVSGGSVTLTVYGASVTILASDNAAAVQTKINAALGTQWMNGNGVTVTGGPLTSAALVVTAAGNYANAPQTITVTSNNLTGSSPTITATHTTTGVASGAWAPYASGNTDGTQTARGILQTDVAADPTGRISFGNSAGTGLLQVIAVGIATNGGQWNTAELIGLDSAAVTSLGQLVAGTLANGVLELEG